MTTKDVKQFYETDKCFFDSRLKCHNVVMGEDSTSHYCRACIHLPNLQKLKVSGRADKTWEGLDYSLLIAIGSSREAVEKPTLLRANSRKIPKWAKILCGNLETEKDFKKRTELYDCVGSFCLGLDHVRLFFDNIGFNFVYEPYTLREDNLEAILKICKYYNLTVIISGESSHFPGHCLRVSIREVIAKFE